MTTAAPALDRDRLVIEHLPVARRLAYSRTLPAHVDRDDVIAAAHLGLVEAAARWDESKGVSFSHFATFRILGAIADMQRGEDPVSRSERRIVRRVDAARERFSAREHCHPTDYELAAEAGVDRREMLAALASVTQAIPLYLEERRVSYRTPDDDSDAIVGVLDPNAERPFQAVLDRPALVAALAGLSSRERYIIARRFLQERTQQQVGDEIGVSEARVSQIETRMRHRLRVLMAAEAA